MMPDGQMDIEDYLSRYPVLPGSKTGGASAEAAQKMARVSVRIDDQVLAFLREHGPECPDRVAEKMGLKIHTVRPALSRLKARGLVEKVPLADMPDGKSDFQNSAHFYRVGGAK